MSLPYRIIVGLEIHVELNTQTKMFCRCVNDPFHASAPNTNVCPICLGLPGTLPVANQEAIRKTVQVGLALGAEINPRSHWDRKHYFYPDLPKGYQISQLDQPFCLGGQVELLAADGSVEKVVRFERAHLEEDAGKLSHGRGGFSEVDLNRAGVPLLEMVSRPDLTSAAEARRFLQELQLLVRTIGVSDADMEKGQMRCDVNINIAFEYEGVEVRTPITEVKNVNSTRAVERSISTETERQYREWLAGGPITKRTGKITVGWDEDKEQINLQRVKEGSADYRYMPEPDLPAVEVAGVPELNPEVLRGALPELPTAYRRRYLALGVRLVDLDALVFDPAPTKRNVLEELVKAGTPAPLAVNWLINAAGCEVIPVPALSTLIIQVEQGQASFSAVKAVLPALIPQLQTAEQVVDALKQAGLLLLHDDGVVQSAVSSVLAANPDVVAQYKAGNERVLGFLVGQVMKQAAGKAQPAKVQAAVRSALQ